MKTQIEHYTLSKRLMIIMSSCVGKNNSITRSGLYTKCFGNERADYWDEQANWMRLLSTMSYLRRNTDCFVVVDYSGKEHKYYILKTSGELKEYHQKIDSAISTLHVLKNKAASHVQNKRYNHVFIKAEKYKKKEMISNE